MYVWGELSSVNAHIRGKNMSIIFILVNLLYWTLSILMLAHVIFSLARVSPYHPTLGPFVQFVHRATEPILTPVRNMIGTSMGLDFSPMIVLFGVSILRNIIFRLL